MKNIIVIFIALCQTIIPLYAQTQPYYFNKLYGNPYPYLENPSVALGKDSGYFLVHSLFDAETDTGRLNVVKLNERGDILSNKRFCNPNNETQMSAIKRDVLSWNKLTKKSTN